MVIWWLVVTLAEDCVQTSRWPEIWYSPRFLTLTLLESVRNPQHQQSVFKRSMSWFFSVILDLSYLLELQLDN